MANYYVLVKQPDGSQLAVARETTQRRATYAAKRYYVQRGFLRPEDARSRGVRVLVGNKADLISRCPEQMREIVAACRELDTALAE